MQLIAALVALATGLPIFVAAALDVLRNARERNKQ
jgi:hypothetical protein